MPHRVGIGPNDAALKAFLLTYAAASPKLVITDTSSGGRAMQFNCRSRATSFAAGLAAVVAIVFSTAPGAAETIKLDSGAIADVAPDASGIRLFKGIPFAAPPTGDLRWQRPHPVKAWEGIRQAQDWGPRC